MDRLCLSPVARRRNERHRRHRHDRLRSLHPRLRLRPACRSCLQVPGLWDRLYLSLAGPSSHQRHRHKARRSLHLGHRLACRNFPQEPDLWDRLYLSLEDPNRYQRHRHSPPKPQHQKLSPECRNCLPASGLPHWRCLSPADPRYTPQHRHNCPKPLRHRLRSGRRNCPPPPTEMAMHPTVGPAHPSAPMCQHSGGKRMWHQHFPLLSVRLLLQSRRRWLHSRRNMHPAQGWQAHMCMSLSRPRHYTSRCRRRPWRCEAGRQLRPRGHRWPRRGRTRHRSLHCLP